MPYRYPVWVNHTRRHFHGKSPEWRLPDEGHGPYSAWAGFVAALWERYAGRMACFEVVNEPNLQLWPQPRRGRPRGLDDRDRRRGGPRARPAATCLAPSISDAESDRPCMITERAPFVYALLDALDRRGFAGGDHWVWSFHNYNDAELGGDRVGRMRAQLAGRWRGRAAADGGPLVFATEGGVRLSGVRRRYGVEYGPERQRAEQAAMLAQAVTRYERTPGVGLFTQYTVNADPGYDCGLREPDGGGGRRSTRGWRSAASSSVRQAPANVNTGIEETGSGWGGDSQGAWNRFHGLRFVAS